MVTEVKKQETFWTTFNPKCSLHLADFGIHKINQTKQQTFLARTLQTSEMNVWRVSTTRTSMLTLRCTDAMYFFLFIVCVLVDSISSARGHAGVRMTLSVRREHKPLDWVLVDSRLCAVRLKGPVRVINSRLKHRSLLIVPLSLEAKDEFHAN